MENLFYSRQSRSALLKRLNKLPIAIAIDVVDDVACALENRIQTMERILAARSQ